MLTNASDVPHTGIVALECGCRLERVSPVRRTTDGYLANGSFIVFKMRHTCSLHQSDLAAIKDPAVMMSPNEQVDYDALRELIES